MTPSANPSPLFFEPRCKACQHPNRAEIDISLAEKVPYTRIESQFGVPYRSLANHHRKHLDYDEPGINALLARNLATALQNREIGVQVAITRRLVLDACIQGFLESLSASLGADPEKVQTN
jgi:hypothetical protein